MHLRSHRLAALAAAAGLGAALSVPAAPAQAPQQQPPPSSIPGAGAQTPGTGTQFNRLDANKDGMVSRSEASANRELIGRWETLDVNRDGSLDMSEFAAFEMPTPGGPAPKEKR